MESQEERDMRTALRNSMQDQMWKATSTAPSGTSPPVSDSTPEQDEFPRPTIDDMIKNLALQRAMDLPAVQDVDGDTWIFIDASPKQPEQNMLEYEEYKKRCQQPLVMKRTTLERLNSPTINKLFDPTQQFRTKRRRQLVNQLPEQIKFVLDLTPPSEGEEAVWFTTSLCCSEGIRLWYLSTLIWKVSSQMVGGEQELLTLNKPRSQKGQWQKANVGASAGGNSSLDGTVVPDEAPMVPEYSPVRHRSSIERVLVAAQGLDPRLDSAPKVWTTFAVARYLEIVHSPLTDYFVRWLRAAPNCYILEVLPETCLIMADHLQVCDLARDSFAILVGEEALDSQCRERNPKSSRRSSVFGRKKEDLPEVIQTRIEYATKSFTDRVLTGFTSFAGQSMDWIDTLPEVQRISHFAQPDLQQIAATLISTLKEYIRGILGELLRVQWQYLPGPVTYMAETGGEQLVPRVSKSEVWQTLSLHERLFTRSFWASMQLLELSMGSDNFSLPGVWYSRDDQNHRPNISETVHTPWSHYHLIPKKLLWKQITVGEDLLKIYFPKPAPKVGSSSSKDQSPWWEDDAKSVSFQIGLRPKKHDEIDDSSDENTWNSSVPTNPAADPVESLDQAPNPPPESIFRFQGPSKFFNLKAFFDQAQRYIKNYAENMLGHGERVRSSELQPINLTNTLVSLEYEEFKYLPLWAGGNDDGSNGVFSDDVPMSFQGFSTPGPGVHTGGSSHTPSEFEMVSAGSKSTFNTSTVTNAGFASELHRDRVYADDSVDGLSSDDDFSMVDYAESFDGGEEEHARRMLREMEEKESRESNNTGAGSKDEDYSDLFYEDDDEDSDGTVVADNDNEE